MFIVFGFYCIWNNPVIFSPFWVEAVSSGQNPAVTDQRAAAQAGGSDSSNSQFHMILTLTWSTSDDSLLQIHRRACCHA